MDESGAKTPRQRAREETEARIVDIGNRMLDDHGVESLSLRAVARELGIVSSAVYRYVKTRDELLTILIVDAFSSLADAVDVALAETRSVESLGLAMLEWSRSHPNRWALIYGTPIASYDAPRDVTVEPGTRVMVRLVELVAQEKSLSVDADLGSASPSGARRDFATAGATTAAKRLAAELETLDVEVDADEALAAISAWVAIIGLISSLRFGQFGPGFDDVEDGLMCGLVRTLRVDS